MTTRNILDKDGNVIGSLTLPACTPEEVWASKLSGYLPAAPVEVNPVEVVRANMDFGRDLIAQFGAEPEANALTTEQTASLIGMLAPVQMMLITGAVQTALVTLQSTDFTGVLSEELITRYVVKMQQYLGV